MPSRVRTVGTSRPYTASPASPMDTQRTTSNVVVRTMPAVNTPVVNLAGWHVLCFLLQVRTNYGTPVLQTVNHPTSDRLELKIFIRFYLAGPQTLYVLLFNS